MHRQEHAHTRRHFEKCAELFPGTAWLFTAEQLPLPSGMVPHFPCHKALWQRPALPTLYLAILPRSASDTASTLRGFRRRTGRDTGQVLAIKSASDMDDPVDFAVTLEVQQRNERGEWLALRDSKHQAELQARVEVQHPAKNILGVPHDSPIFAVTPPTTAEWSLEPGKKYRLLWRVRHERLTGGAAQTRQAAASASAQAGVRFDKVQVRLRCVCMSICIVTFESNTCHHVLEVLLRVSVAISIRHTW